MARWAGDMAIAAILSAVFTFFGLVLIFFTLIYTKRAARHAESMVKPAQDAARAAIDAVTAAQAGNEHAARMGEIETRAYLSAGEVRILTIYGDPSAFSLVFPLTNFGSSPAYNVTAIYVATCSDEVHIGGSARGLKPFVKTYPLASMITSGSVQNVRIQVQTSDCVDGEFLPKPNKEINRVEAIIGYQTAFDRERGEMSGELSISVPLPTSVYANLGNKGNITPAGGMPNLRSNWMNAAMKIAKKNAAWYITDQHEE